MLNRSTDIIHNIKYGPYIYKHHTKLTVHTAYNNSYKPDVCMAALQSALASSASRRSASPRVRRKRTARRCPCPQPAPRPASTRLRRETRGSR